MKEQCFLSGKDLTPLTVLSLFSTSGNTKLLAEFIRNEIFIELGPRHGADALILPLVDLYFTGVRNMSGRVMAFSVYAHFPCSGISALLNMGIRDM